LFVIVDVMQQVLTKQIESFVIDLDLVVHCFNACFHFLEHFSDFWVW